MAVGDQVQLCSIKLEHQLHPAGASGPPQRSCCQDELRFYVNAAVTQQQQTSRQPRRGGGARLEDGRSGLEERRMETGLSCSPAPQGQRSPAPGQRRERVISLIQQKSCSEGDPNISQQSQHSPAVLLVYVRRVCVCGQERPLCYISPQRWQQVTFLFCRLVFELSGSELGQLCVHGREHLDEERPGLQQRGLQVVPPAELL